MSHSQSPQVPNLPPHDQAYFYAKQQMNGQMRKDLKTLEEKNRFLDYMDQEVERLKGKKSEPKIPARRYETTIHRYEKPEQYAKTLTRANGANEEANLQHILQKANFTKCQGCGKSATRDSGVTFVNDHDHLTGESRNLKDDEGICSECNTLMGRVFQDGLDKDESRYLTDAELRDLLDAHVERLHALKDYLNAWRDHKKKNLTGFRNSLAGERDGSYDSQDDSSLKRRRGRND